MKRLLFFLVFMTLGTALVLELSVTHTVNAPQPSQGAPGVANVLDMHGVTMHQMEGERVRWELNAQRATYNENTNAGLLEDVQFRVFRTADGDGPAVFTGRSAHAFLGAGGSQFVLEGQVVLEQGEALVIRSERVEYDQEQELITVPGQVEVRTPQGAQRGSSLRYSIPEQRLDFENPVFYQ